MTESDDGIDEDDIIEELQQHGPMEKDDLIESVGSIGRCPCCGQIGDSGAFRIAQTRVDKVLEKLMDKNRVSFTIDWKLQLEDDDD